MTQTWEWQVFLVCLGESFLKFLPFFFAEQNQNMFGNICSGVHVLLRIMLNSPQLQNTVLLWELSRTPHPCFRAGPADSAQSL